MSSFFSTNGFMPHGHCYLWNPSLVWTMGITDILIGLAYISISVSLYALVKKIRIPFSAIFLAFGLFIGACGATHFMEVVTLWYPYYWVAAFIKILTSLASIVTAIYLVKLTPKILELAKVAKIADERRISIEEAYQENNLENQDFRRILRWSVFFPLLLLFALSSVFFFQARYMLQSASRVDHSNQVIEQANIAAKNSLSAQTSFRGYLMRNDKKFLDLFRLKSQKFYDVINNLKNMVQDNPGQVDRAKLVEDNFDNWIFYTQEFFNAPQNANKVEFVTKGEEIFGRVTSNFDLFLNDESSLAVLRRTKTDKIAETLILTTISFGILLGGLIGYFGRAQLLRLSRSYDKAFDDLKNKNDILRQALKSRDEFLSVASHELRTPIMALQLQTRLLKGYSKEDNIVNNGPKILKVVETCDKQSDRLARLIELLLDLTRIRLGKIELTISKVDLVALVEEMVPHVRASRPDYTNTVTIKAPEFIEGQWDRGRLEQIVTNLISNAFKYGKKGPIEIDLIKDENQQKAIFKIKDQGIGVDDHLKDKIFERFERAVSGEHISGLGLGLYIVTQLVRAHGGKINLKTEVNKGSTFTLDLPLRIPTRSAYETELSKESISL